MERSIRSAAGQKHSTLTLSHPAAEQKHMPQHLPDTPCYVLVALEKRPLYVIYVHALNYGKQKLRKHYLGGRL